MDVGREDLAKPLHGGVPRQCLVDPPQEIRYGLAEMSENELESRMTVEQAGEDEAQGVGSRFDRIAPRCASEHRMGIGIGSEIGAPYRRHDLGGVKVEWNVQRL